MRLKLFAILAATGLALLGTTGARAADAAAETEEYKIPNHPYSLQLDGLGLREVAIQTKLRDSAGNDIGKVPNEAALRSWTQKALETVGYRITGDADDPKLVLFANCEGKRCDAFAWLVRDTYIRKVSGGQQYFIRSPDLAVGEWSSVYSSELPEDAAGLEQAAYGSVRGAILEFSKAVIEAQKPEVLAREKRLFVSPLPRRASN